MSAVTDFLPRGTEPAHTDTAMCLDGLAQRWEQLSERGPLLMSKQTGMVHRITCFDLFSVASTSQSRNISDQPIDGTVTLKLAQVSLHCSERMH